MTDTEKRTAEKLRAEGYSYNMISKTLGISLSTVKSHIRRKTKIVPHPQTDSPSGILCKRCGATLVNTPGHRQKIFCSKSCQERYWREHRDISLCESLVSCTCAGCGKEILDYKGKHRKYCSHKCYIAVRYGRCCNE